MPRTFVTSDHHFGHENIIKLANRPFESVTEMNRVLVDNWNALVTPNDTVIHLGDFAYRMVLVEALNIWDRLNGRKILVAGNHDSSEFLSALNAKGVPIHDYLEWLSPKGRRICLFHYPMLEWNGYFQGSIALHGHTHKPQVVTAPGLYNVAVEAWNYVLPDLKEIERCHQNQEKKYENHN